MAYQSKVVFSIPGRVRIHHPLALRDKKTVRSMIGTVEDLPGVISVSANRRTGNILIRYDVRIISEQQISARIDEPVTIGIHFPVLKSFARNIKRALSPGLFLTKSSALGQLHGEYHLSRKLVKFSVLLAVMVYFFQSIAKRFFAMLVFGCPLIIFAIPLSAFYFTAVRAGNRRIYFKEIASVEKFRLAETVYLHDSVLISENRDNNRDLIYQKLQHPDFRRFLALGKMNELFNVNITDFIFGIRENGITDIAIASTEELELTDMIARQLGIVRIIRLYDNVTMLDFFQNHTIIVTAEEEPDKIYHAAKGIVLYVCNKKEGEEFHSEAAVHRGDLQRIPWLIGLSRYCKEMIIRCENSAIAVNSLGLLLSALGYLNPVGALSVYSMNMAGQIFFIRRKILSYQKEIAVEEKSFITEYRSI